MVSQLKDKVKDKDIICEETYWEATTDYATYLASNKCKHDPFSDFHISHILDETKYTIVVPNRWPYTQDHLLIIPKRNVLYQNELSQNEKIDFWMLSDKRLEKLHTQYSNVSYLIRDSLVWNQWKSIAHIHGHLIPEIVISTLDFGWNYRNFLNDKEYSKICESIRTKFCTSL